MTYEQAQQYHQRMRMQQAQQNADRNSMSGPMAPGLSPIMTNSPVTNMVRPTSQHSKSGVVTSRGSTTPIGEQRDGSISANMASSNQGQADTPQQGAAATAALENRSLQLYENIDYASANDPSSTKVLRSDRIRKKNARFEIPKERNLQTIDALILAATDENEKKELKQQKRLLRNRQAALDSRQRKKTYTEKLEQEKKVHEKTKQQEQQWGLETSHSAYSVSDPLMQEFLHWKRQQELQKQRQQMPMMRDSVPVGQTILTDWNPIPPMYSHNHSGGAASEDDQKFCLSSLHYVDPVEVERLQREWDMARSERDLARREAELNREEARRALGWEMGREMGIGGPTPDLSHPNQKDPSSTVCYLNLRCLNEDCEYAHQSPAAPAGTEIDMSNTCSFAAACKNSQCHGKHPSPALIAANKGIETDLPKHDAPVLRRDASHTQHSSLSAPRQSPSTKEQADMPHADSTFLSKITARLDEIPPTDSGYASHKPTHNAHPDHKDQTEVVMEAPGSIKPTYAATSYSNNASLETIKRDTFVEKLAEQLVTDLGITSANASNALKLCDEIVDILAEFALKLGYGACANELERAMVFIHKYRKDIGSCFRSRILCQDHEDEYDDDETRSRSDEMPLSDKMQMYRDSMIVDPATEFSPAGNFDYAIELDQDSAPTDDIEDFNKYLSYVCKTPHYEWLLATSRCKIILTSNNETISNVRRSILSVLPQATNVGKLSCRHLQTVFSVHWTPQRLLEQRWRSFHHASSPRNQPHDENNKESDGSFAISSFTLGDILTITGESSGTQALSCSAYLTQTWPMTGRFVLQLLEEVIIHGTKNERSVQRTDGTQITVSQEDEQSLKVLVSGTKDAIAEVGEQLAWLGAALRCSPSEEGMVYCTARISWTETPVVELNTEDKNLNAAISPKEARPRLNDRYLKYYQELPRDARGLFSFNIDFELEDVPGPVSPSGTCWTHLFQSPVIARGFPVMRRAQPSLGLEMPLNVMAGLLGTTYVHTFGGGIFLKGHSAILYPTQTVEDVVVWHLHFDSRKHYMPYPSNDEAKLAEVDAGRLAELRHVVGWCKAAENRTGIVEGNHKTERCNRLRWARTGCVLEGYGLSFGKSIVGGVPFTLLSDHDSLHIIRKSYSTMLNYLSTRFVVFFDVRDRRGWLVNGVNALHHILRTSLEEDKARSIQNQNSLFVLRLNQLIEPKEAGAASVAWQFLDNRDNIFCRISLSNIVNDNSEGGGSGSHKEVYETLRNRLEQFHDALEILFNYQIQAEEPCGRQNRSRAIYEGWGFVDVARRREQRPRMMKLPLEGLACVDLLRSARVVTLFGNGFGDLILPSPETFCRGWQTLPKMKYYIASSTADIQKLIKEEGESSRQSGEPPQLSCVGRIMWYSPPVSLDDCRCDTGDTCLAKVVQVSWPRKYRSLVKDMKGPGTLESDGAVVFGYNSLVPWHWPEIGDPRPGPPPVLVAEDSDDDSGLGSSIDSMATDQSTVTTTIPKSMIDYRRGHSLFPPLEQSPKMYGNATVSGGRHNHFGDSFHQIVNNYQQQTTDIAELGTTGLKHERNCGIMEPPERFSKRKRLV